MNLKIELENLAAGNIDIALSSLDGRKLKPNSSNKTNEVLSVSASIKPL